MTVDRPEGVKLVGFYRGKVVQHMSNGMCKVFVPGVYPDAWESDPDKLPPAEQASPLFGGGVGGKGTFSYPGLGATVGCFFWNGDQNLPAYFAQTLGGPEAAERWAEARPHVTEETVAGGEDAYVHKIDVNRSTVKIWESGFIEVVVKSDDAGVDQVKVTLDGKGNLVASTTQQVQVTAPNVKLTAGQAMTLEAETIKVTAGSRLEVTTPQYTCMNGLSHNVISPSINLDASAGAVAIKGKAHSEFVY